MGNNHNTTTVVPVDLNELTIYEGGNLNEISISDLKGNEIAIKQLLNTYHLNLKEVKKKDDNISMLNSQLEYLKTSPYMSIVTALINIGGTITVGIAINMQTLKPAVAYSSWLLLTGAILVLIGSSANIFYPYARKWFNKKTIANTQN